MFTGLIQSVGRIDSIQPLGREKRFTISSKPVFEDLQLGESIAVNGVCLSVEAWGPRWFRVYASAETLERSNLAFLKNRSRVNLERALTLGDRFGGHLVNGHVDCLALLDNIQPAGQSWIYSFSFPEKWSSYVVDKGSVALDGISLTVNVCEKGYLKVNIIPSTQKQTTVQDWKPGCQVNMEVDIIAKYVQNMLAPLISDGKRSSHEIPNRGISQDFLQKHGF